MKSLLRSLYNGEIFLAEARVPSSTECATLRKRLAENNQKLSERLSGEDAKMLEAYCEARDRLAAMEEDDLFIFAFSCGARFMIDIFHNDPA